MTVGLDAFRDPRSVTLVGASADPAKWGWHLARGLLRGRDQRCVRLVNRSAETIAGVASVRSLDELSGASDLVVLCVPAADLPVAIDQALVHGASGLLAVTAGVDRVVGPGTEEGLTDRVRAAGARLIGPNSLGLFDATSRLEALWGTVVDGSLGIVSQSGQIALELSGLAARTGLGVSRLVSVGNQVDVTAAELLEDLVGHDATRVVALYLESFVDARRLVAAMRLLRESGKPVLLLTVGSSEAGRSAALSHTEAITSPTEVVDAACRAGGALRVDTPTELIDAATVLVCSPWPRGCRVAIVSDSGGQGAIAADLTISHGLEVPPLPLPTQQMLAARLPRTATVTNPIDLAGGGEQDITTYAMVVREVAVSGAVDAIVVSGYFGSYCVDVPALATAELAVARRLASVATELLPVAVHSQCASSPTLDALREHGVPTSDSIERAVVAIGHARSVALRRLPEFPSLPTPDPATPVHGYWEARSLLARAGVPYPSAVPVSTPDGIHAAARSLAGPFALKADRLAHKSDVGGLCLDLTDADDAVAALAEMVDRLGMGRYVLETMDTHSDVVELLVGARWDPAFGPIVVVGQGGVAAEVHADYTVELGPVDRDTALAMLRRLRVWPLLDGWRGRSAADTGAVATAIVSLSSISSRRPDLTDIELNPLRAGCHGAIAVDAAVTSLADTPIGR